MADESDTIEVSEVTDAGAQAVPTPPEFADDPAEDAETTLDALAQEADPDAEPEDAGPQDAEPSEPEAADEVDPVAEFKATLRAKP
ncbi:MAG: hypothetical protein WAR57_00105, partial [Candidatus Phosphoribacter sp.]